MLEIHLFVNPLGAECKHSEDEVLKSTNLKAAKVRINIIPLLNMQTISRTIRLYHLPENDLTTRIQLSQAMYQAILDYKAAQFQGQRRARLFLVKLQSQLNKDPLRYDDQLATKVAKAAGLDVKMFQEDRHGKLAKKSFESDQRLADDEGIRDTETAIVVDTSYADCGIKISHFDLTKLMKYYERVHCAKCVLQQLANKCASIRLYQDHQNHQVRK